MIIIREKPHPEFFYTGSGSSLSTCDGYYLFTVKLSDTSSYQIYGYMKSKFSFLITNYKEFSFNQNEYYLGKLHWLDRKTYPSCKCSKVYVVGE